MSGENISNVSAEVRAIYSELAKRPVTRQCVARTECCQFQLTGRTSADTLEIFSPLMGTTSF